MFGALNEFPFSRGFKDFPGLENNFLYSSRLKEIKDHYKRCINQLTFRWAAMKGKLRASVADGRLSTSLSSNLQIDRHPF